MDGIIELLGYIAVGIFVIFNRLYRRKKTNENDYGLTEDGKLKLPFINELIEPETEPVPEQKELIPDEIEVMDQDEILDDPIAFEPNMASYSEQKSDELEPNHPFIDFKPSNARQAIIYSEILRPPKSLR
ncbi:MAG: hypothetical protein VX830_05220 [Candidatus Poribacteria bacterium]|nr:hypothetical protein [Candidatus Poribacteria bacterium]